MKICIRCTIFLFLFSFVALQAKNWHVEGEFLPVLNSYDYSKIDDTDFAAGRPIFENNNNTGLDRGFSLSPVSTNTSNGHEFDGTFNRVSALPDSGTINLGVATEVMLAYNLEFTSDTVFEPEIYGDFPCSGHDQIKVIGTVELNNATLNPTGGYANEPSTVIVLIDNDGTDAIVGTFSNYAEGDIVSFGEFSGMISYQGGDGNDVVLRGIPVPVITDLVIIEILYHPNSSDAMWEWIELYNKGTETIDLSGFVFDTPNSSLRSNSNILEGTIEPGGVGVLFDSDVSSAEFKAVWGTMNAIPVSEWPDLDNEGDSIGIWQSYEAYLGDAVSQLNVIEQVVYDDENGWVDSNAASSIYLNDISTDNTIAANWILSEVDVAGSYQSLALHGNNGNDIGSPGLLPQPDTQAPTIICPETVNLVTDEGSCTAIFELPGLEVNDNVSSIENISISVTRDDNLALENPFPLGETMLTYIVTDEAGNSSFPCEQLIIVQDIELPELTCPADIMITVSSGQSIGIEQPIVTDNCIGEITLTSERSDNANLSLEDVFPIGTTTILWTALDTNGNHAVCTQTIILNQEQSFEKDITAVSVPNQIGQTQIDQIEKRITISVPANTDVTAIEPTIIVSAGATVSPDSGLPNDFTTPLTYTVTAQNGSTQDWILSIIVESCEGFELTVQDATNPTTCSGIDGFALVAQTGGSLPLSYSWSHDETLSGNQAIDLPAGIYTVVVTDARNCTTELTFELTDPELPEVTLTPFEAITEGAPQILLSGGLPKGGVYSGAGVVDGSFDPSVGIGTYDITYTYIDETTNCQNSALQTITVEQAVVIDSIADQFNIVSEDIGIISITLSGGNPNDIFSFEMSGQPNGISINGQSGSITGIIDTNAASEGPNNDGVYTVTISAINQDSQNATLQFQWTVSEPVAGVVWFEDFEDLSNGATVDNGATAWTSTRDAGTFAVSNGSFLTSGNSASPGVWTSEVIPVSGSISLSVDVDDADNRKEPADFVNAYYVLDGGPQVLFGSVSDDISPQTFTVTGLSGSTVQIIIESDVSTTNEFYLIDNVTVSSEPTGTTQFDLTVGNGSGDGQYEAGTVVNIAADAAPSGQEFDIWTGDVAGISDVNSPSTSITMPAGNTTVTATYRDISPATEYDLTVGNGSGDGQYEAGTVVNIAADAAPSGQEFDIWTGDVAGISDVNSPSTSITIPAVNTTVTATYRDIPLNGVVWLEDFEDLVNGATSDNGATAWSSVRDAGTFAVSNGSFLTSGNSASPGVWTSEVISVSGSISLSVDVDDADNTKEPADFVNAYYVLDGGPQVLFGSVSDDISPQTFTVTGLSGSTVQIIIESDVSTTNEFYLIDNVTVSGEPIGTTQFDLTVDNGSGDGQYGAGTVVNIAADGAPSGKEFDVWTGDVAGISDVNNPSTSITIPTGNTTVTATYRDISPATEYDLTVDNGSGDGQYEAGTVVNIAADAAPSGQEFDIWTGDVAGISDVNSPSTSITMPAGNTTVTATYRDISPATEYDLTVGNGSGDGQYEAGTVVNLIAEVAPSGQEFDIWTGDVAGISDVNSPSTSITMPAENTTVTATYSDIPTGGVVWFEDFEDLSNGATVDNGATAWTSVRDAGTFAVSNGSFLTSGNSASPGVWTSEVIPVSGTISISVDVNDADNTKEPADFVNAYYVFDGGPQVLFGSVSDDISPQTFTVTGLSGSTVQIIIESDVSTTNEFYLIDNVTVSSEPTGTTQFDLTVDNGSGDGQYEAGTVVNIAADGAPSGQEFDVWTGDVSGISDVNSPSTSITMPAGNTTVTATYRDIALNGVIWLEDFEDLINGATSDNGATAWTSTRDTGTFSVSNGTFLTSGNSVSNGVWTSEAIPISGSISLSVDVDDADNNKEPADFVNAYYVLDGGPQVLFGSVSDDISPQTFTVMGLSGSTVQIVIESDVSTTNEFYLIDNVTVAEDGSSSKSSNSLSKASGNEISNDVTSEIAPTETMDDGFGSSYIYPNPTSESIGIRLGNPKTGITTIGLYDLTGKLVRLYGKSDIVLTRDGVHVPIESENIENGIYMVRINFESIQPLYYKVVVRK